MKIMQYMNTIDWNSANTQRVTIAMIIDNINTFWWSYRSPVIPPITEPIA